MYYRCTNKNTPMSDWGHAMFCDDIYKISHYGENLYTYDGTNGIHIKDLEGIIKSTWLQCQSDDDWTLAEANGADMDYYKNLSADEICKLLNPTDIVDTAAAWDSELCTWFWFYIAEPNGIPAVITNNGAIVWDESLIKKEDKDEILLHTK